jgi:hypothetical protein
MPTIPQSQLRDIQSRGTVGQTTGINPNPMSTIPAGTAGIKPQPSPGKRDSSEGTPRPEPRSTGVSERPDNTEGQLPEFTGTVPNTTATGRVFQPDTTTRTPTGDDGAQLPPDDDTTQARPANVAEARAQQQAEDFPDRADFTTDDEYAAAVQEYFENNPIDYSNIGGGNIFTGGGIQTSGLSQAPIDLEINLPDRPDLPQVTPEDVAYGPDSMVYEMADTGDATATRAAATAAQAQADATAAQAGTPRDVTAAQMEAAVAAGVAPGEAAQGQVSEGAIARVDEGTITAPAVAAQRDAKAEQAARAVAAQRPEARDYASAVTGGIPAEVEDIEGPAVITREGATISEAEVERLGQIAQGRGVDLQDLPEYKDKIKKRIAQQGEAATAQYRSRLGEAPQARAAQARFEGVDDTPQARQQRIEEFEAFTPAKREAYTALGVDAPEAAQMENVRQAAAASREAITADAPPEVIAEQTDLDQLGTYQMVAQRTAQVAEAAEGIATQLSGQPSLDLEGRQAILGEAPAGDAAQIGGIPTAQAAQMQAVTGQARKMAAADMATVVVEMPPEVTAAISEDPATVEAQLDTGEDPQVVAAVAALPEEALVSTQMEGLLAGMEDGEVPMWARPAVDAINAQMAQRGLSTSTVGRDALFNAIIQSALPMAQSNAQALQQRATQNLSNQQQANLEQSKQIASLRMQNLANRQTAASQTAQMAQQIKVQQGEFRQQAQILTAQQEQQSRMADVQFQQPF